MRWAAILLISLPFLARAHKPVSVERAIVQVGPGETRILYELSFPAGPEATRWRVLFDADRNGLLDAREWPLLARGVADKLAQRLEVKLEGNRLPLTVEDAKVSPGGGDGPAGPFQALVMLTARALPAGLRTLDLSLEPLVDANVPVLVRFEAVGAELRSIVGGGRAGPDSAELRRREPVRVLVDVPKPSP